MRKREKISEQIKLNLEESKKIDNNWDDKNKSLFFISNCINIENNIKYMSDIKNNITKLTDVDIKITFMSENELLLNTIKNFGKVMHFNIGLFENILKKSKIIENKEQIKLLKEWLPYKNKDELKCKLIYDAKKDGDDVAKFHSLCDNKGPTLTIISTSDNKKIGGFLSTSFNGNKGNINDNNAFLFSLNYNEKYPSLNKSLNYQDKKEYGPIFGNTCIEIKDKFFSNRNNYYESYTSRYDFGKRHNNIIVHFFVLELEIYQIINEENLI